MNQNLINRIKSWLYDFDRKNENQDYIISDGDMLDDAKFIFEDLIKTLDT